MAIKELAKALKSGVRYVIATRIIELAVNATPTSFVTG
jgi:hypothetical protein